MKMSLKCTTMALSLLLLSLTLANSDSTKDREACEDQLVGLATCLPYVGGDAKAPTPDCCNGLKQVLKNNKTCLCVIVRDRNDPELGLNINATLALSLPSVCHAPANVSQCPALLHLAPNSTEAQVFYQFGSSSNHSATSPAPNVAENSTISSSNNQSLCRGQTFLGLETVAKWVLVCVIPLVFLV